MAYDEELASRIRALIAAEPGLTEQKMFGGLAFLLNGNMSVAASGEGGIMLRVDPDESQALTESSSAVPVVMRGREMRGWLRVDSPTYATTPSWRGGSSSACRSPAPCPPSGSALKSAFRNDRGVWSGWIGLQSIARAHISWVTARSVVGRALAIDFRPTRALARYARRARGVGHRPALE